MQGRVFIGTSGWNYKHWRGDVFYPDRLKPAAWLAHYAQHFDSVEVNNTFYRLPQEAVFRAWREQTPESFVFAVKASRFITHMKKLLDPEQHVAQFLERASGLGSKLRVVLFQLPPFWRYNASRLGDFCRYLSQQEIIPGLRFALEVRHPSWLASGCFDVLRRHNVALAFADWPNLKVNDPITADFVFVRRHGPHGLYSSDYSMPSLRQEAERIDIWSSQGRDVYIYFNNDVQGFAVKNASTLKALLPPARLTGRRSS